MATTHAPMRARYPSCHHAYGASSVIVWPVAGFRLQALPQLLHLDFRGTDYTLDPDPEWLLEDISKDSASKIVTNAGAGDFVVTKLDNTFLLILNDYGAVATFSILGLGLIWTTSHEFLGPVPPLACRMPV